MVSSFDDGHPEHMAIRSSTHGTLSPPLDYLLLIPLLIILGILDNVLSLVILTCKAMLSLINCFDTHSAGLL